MTKEEKINEFIELCEGLAISNDSPHEQTIIDFINSLKSENNNGWIKIEIEDWLKETRIDGTVRYYVDNIEDDYFDIAVQINDEEKSILGLSDYLFIKEELDKDGINPTHYQPIEKPKPPLY